VTHPSAGKQLDLARTTLSVLFFGALPAGSWLSV
jgi:hypothetical protein